MTRRAALVCAHCDRSIRRGQPVVVTTFAHYVGTTDGVPRIESWLSVVAHLSHEGPLTAAAIRQAQAARTVLSGHNRARDGAGTGGD